MPGADVDMYLIRDDGGIYYPRETSPTGSDCRRLSQKPVIPDFYNRYNYPYPTPITVSVYFYEVWGKSRTYIQKLPEIFPGRCGFVDY